MIAEQRITDGRIAVLNLEAQIGALRAEVGYGSASVETRIELGELIALRGLILARIADYETADAIAEQLVREATGDPRAWLARARTRAAFGRFDEALADLDRAELLSIDGDTACGERAAIFQAIGRYDDACVLREEAVAREASFENVAALVGLHAERGERRLAERRHVECRNRYRGVSPFPLALLQFQLGLMWMNEGKLDRASGYFESAQWLVPAFAAAAGHSAEVEAGLGDIDCAVDRLAPVARSSDDPIHAAQLARVLLEAGRDLESQYWRRLAAVRYDELIASHPEAFAGHAVEFWLAAGGDPDKALRLARRNLGIRATPRARALLDQALAGTAKSCPDSSLRRCPPADPQFSACLSGIRPAIVIADDLPLASPDQTRLE